MRKTAFIDPVIEGYKRDVDRTLLRENLKLTPGQRFAKFASFAAFADELKQAGRRSKRMAKRRSNA